MEHGFIVKIYDKTKYEKDSKLVSEVKYDEIDNLTVTRISDNDIYNMGFDQVDEFGEYVIINFPNGSRSTFRNSHVDVFRA